MDYLILPLDTNGYPCLERVKTIEGDRAALETEVELMGIGDYKIYERTRRIRVSVSTTLNDIPEPPRARHADSN
jgi:hypothetical protein